MCPLTSNRSESSFCLHWYPLPHFIFDSGSDKLSKFSSSRSIFDSGSDKLSKFSSSRSILDSMSLISLDPFCKTEVFMDLNLCI